MDGIPYDFRLKKLDAFSGVSLLRMLSRTPQPGASAGEETAEGSEKPDSLQSVLFALPEVELKSLMTACLNHAEVLLPAGYQPVMTGSEWAWPDFLHDPFPEGAGEHDRLIYSLGTTRGLAGTIEIQPEWMNYLYTNYAIISGWVELCMIRYLQRRNPNVPGLADKIRAPEARKLKKAKDFWNAVVTIVKRSLWRKR